MKKTGTVICVVVICLVAGGCVYAAMPDAQNVKAVYENATVGCTVCHAEGNFKELNAYGKAYNEAGRSVDAVRAIEGADSDGDGSSNGDELNAGTNPGVAATE
ncbi:MAG: thrombospondin type 3 repeat-containing protein [Candidatus Omnitrophica bacterium]|nr:thrombospondin type 3 repeat-containing protein [Candidatus Omnitrophota bacterium]MBU4478707.1 thrombospondin type 3 repeat-containing protein [Candidatus Omnitrophota bacterium]MCG2703160.1 thrombospondin type 3 repeat-containing protein [Candidatus Omnitrophota bacterium]